jgi:hypothetical protein
MKILWPDTQFEGGPNMLQRVALVMWWTAATVIVVSIGGVAFVLLAPKPQPFFAIILGVLAFLAWAIGRASNHRTGRRVGRCNRRRHHPI